MPKIQKQFAYITLIWAITVGVVVLGLLATPITQAHEYVPESVPTPPGALTLSLEEVIKRSLAHNPAVKQIDFELAEKLAEAFEVGVLDNPEATADSLFEDGRGSPKWEIELEQPLRVSNFGARQSYAQHLEKLANLEQKAALLAVINEAVGLYFDFWLLQQRETFLKATERQVKAINHQVGHASERGERFHYLFRGSSTA